MGGVLLLSCVTFSIGQYCLPVLPIILGVVGLLTAKNSLNPDRTRLLSWLSIGAGGVVILLLAIVFLGIIALSVMADSGF